MNTARGFRIVEFTDLYNKPCSLQESSLATDEAIWLGVHGHRMHLNREQTAALLWPLLHFVLTGRLPEKE